MEKLPSNSAYDLAVRDGKTGFVFFNLEGGHYDYEANAHLLSITGGRLMVSNEFAKALGRPSDAGTSWVKSPSVQLWNPSRSIISTKTVM